MATGITMVPAGVALTISAPEDDSALRYAFVTGAADAPRQVQVRMAGGFSINTGRMLLADFDYLFDQQSGEIGFYRARP